VSRAVSSKTDPLASLIYRGFWGKVRVPSRPQ